MLADLQHRQQQYHLLAAASANKPQSVRHSTAQHSTAQLSTAQQMVIASMFVPVSIMLEVHGVVDKLPDTELDMRCSTARWPHLPATASSSSPGRRTEYKAVAMACVPDTN